MKPVGSKKEARGKALRATSTVTGAKCGANLVGGNGKCKNAAGYGTSHPGYGRCKSHMGSTPAGVVRAAKEQAWDLMQYYGTPIETDPTVALLDEIARTAGHIAWIGQELGTRNLEAELLEEAQARIDERDDAALCTAAVQITKYLHALYANEREHLVKVSKASIDAGVAQRQVEFAEQQGRMLAQVIEAILGDLNLTVKQRQKVPSVARKHLAALPLASGG